MKNIYTLFESTTFLRFPELYASLDISETRFQSARQFNKAISRQVPDIVMAEFRYGFGNNYASVNVSNLDVSLYTLQRHAPDARVIVVADKTEIPHLPKLQALFDIDVMLPLPVSESSLDTALRSLEEKR